MGRKLSAEQKQARADKMAAKKAGNEEVTSAVPSKGAKVAMHYPTAQGRKECKGVSSKHAKYTRNDRGIFLIHADDVVAMEGAGLVRVSDQ